MTKDIRDEFEYKRLKQLIGELPETSRAKLEAMMVELDDGRLAYSVGEVAELLGKPETTIRTWLRKGLLRGTKVGREWLIPRTELDRVLDPEGKEQE